MADPIRVSHYAKLRGVSIEAVRQAILKGRLKACVVEVKGKPWITDAALADREWDLNTEAKHRRKDHQPYGVLPLANVPPAERARAIVEGVGRAAAELRGPAPDLPEDYDPTAVDPATGVLPKAISQARREYFDSETARIKSEQLSGKLVDREEVTRAAFNVAREVRDALFLIKDRLSDELATMTDPSKISEYLDKEFRQALTKLAEEISLDGTDAS